MSAENQVLTGNWDVFLSHASEDKASFVEALADELQERGLSVWYDNDSLPVGRSIRAGIDNGLLKSRYTLVIVSKHYIRKEWTKMELDALFTLEADGKQTIIPIIHHILLSEIKEFSPLLASKKAVNSNIGVEQVVGEVIQIVG